MVELQRIKPRWTECIVAATGPSLTPEVAHHVTQSKMPVLAVNDAYRLLPFADVLYACDGKWWDVHQGCPAFAGEKWSSHDDGSNKKTAHAEKYGLWLVKGKDGDGFSSDPECIHYGSNSGFQALNLAILFGATRIVLVGYDMRTNGKRHFFGNHPDPLSNTMRYETLVGYFEKASRRLSQEIAIVNCTPGSALTCFPYAELEETVKVW